MKNKQDKKRILIIDDEENFTKSIKFYLEQIGIYEVKIENKGARGIASAKEFNPDLILLDVIMPDVDGGDVCYQLKNDKDTEDIPIVFLTAAVNKNEIRDYKGVIGGHHFVPKPVEVSQLISVIEKNIR